jgi:hypothetical protein
MVYTPNPAKAAKWNEALNAGKEEFEKLSAKTRKIGFTLPIIRNIMRNVWPYFTDRTLEEKLDVYEALIEMFESFWTDYDSVMRDMEREFGPNPDDVEFTSGASFRARLSTTLELLSMYEDVLDGHEISEQ